VRGSQRTPAESRADAGQSQQPQTLWVGNVPLPAETNVTWLLRLDRNSRAASLKSRMAALQRLRPDTSTAVRPSPANGMPIGMLVSRLCP
jgi:hypothetical protein